MEELKLNNDQYINYTSENRRLNDSYYIEKI